MNTNAPTSRHQLAPYMGICVLYCTIVVINYGTNMTPNIHQQQLSKNNTKSCTHLRREHPPTLQQLFDTSFMVSLDRRLEGFQVAQGCVRSDLDGTRGVLGRQIGFPSCRECWWVAGSVCRSIAPRFARVPVMGRYIIRGPSRELGGGGEAWRERFRIARVR